MLDAYRPRKKKPPVKQTGGSKSNATRNRSSIISTYQAAGNDGSSQQQHRLVLGAFRRLAKLLEEIDVGEQVSSFGSAHRRPAFDEHLLNRALLHNDPAALPAVSYYRQLLLGKLSGENDNVDDDNSADELTALSPKQCVIDIGRLLAIGGWICRGQLVGFLELIPQIEQTTFPTGGDCRDFEETISFPRQSMAQTKDAALVRERMQQLRDRQLFSKRRTELMRIDSLNCRHFPMDLIGKSAAPFPFTNPHLLVPTERQLSLQSSDAVEKRREFLRNLLESVQRLQRQTIHCREFTRFYRTINDCVIADQPLLENIAGLSALRLTAQRGSLCAHYLALIREYKDRLVDRLIDCDANHLPSSSGCQPLVKSLLLLKPPTLPYFIKKTPVEESKKTIAITEEIKWIKSVLRRQEFVGSLLLPKN